jgi:hypothetical protein
MSLLYSVANIKQHRIDLNVKLTHIFAIFSSVLNYDVARTGADIAEGRLEQFK